MLELLAWVAGQPRTYREAMEAWRSSCPRHPVWDDALLQGLIRVAGGSSPMHESKVSLTERGEAMLAAAGAPSRPSATCGDTLPHLDHFVAADGEDAIAAGGG